MSDSPPCPECASEFTYSDGILMNCSICAHAWSLDAPPESNADASSDEDAKVVRDALGNILNDGDDVIVVKSLKVKGAQSALKIGTKVTNIRLVDGDHDIDCKIPGFGPMMLKSSIVRKA